MLKKLVLVLSFVFLVIVMMGASCGSQPKGKLDNISASTLTFATRVNNTDTKTFTFTNTGDANLTYTLSTDAPWLTISNTTGSLVPGQTTTVTLLARCSQEGTFTGEVTVSTNGGNGTVAVSLTCTPVPASQYDIDFEFFGAGMTPARRQVFTEAAGLWSAIIIGDLQDVNIQLDADDRCGFGEGAFSGTIDDLLILASIGPIDGEGGILGQAGPSFIRGDTDDLTFIGCMEFDEADVAALEADGTFNEVILHEMGHVLGFGSLWEPRGIIDIDLLDEPCASNSSATPGFNGPNAVLEFGVLGGTGNPPAENDYGDGTRCSHWDEGFFDNELMTGFLGGVTSITVNPFSALTIAAMEDMGYDVDYSEAEPYSIPSCSPDCDVPALRIANAETAWEVVLKPRGAVDVEGNIVMFENQ